MTCTACRDVAALPTGAGRLHLWLPTAVSAARLTKRLAQDSTVVRGAAYGLTIDVAPESLDAVLRTVGEAVTSVEADAGRALFVEAGREPSAADLPRVESIAQAVGRTEGRWLGALLENGALTTVFQPIVRADAPHEVFGQEALLRSVNGDGSLGAAGPLFSAARASGMLFQLDLAARSSAIAAAARARIDTRLFVNFTPTAIYDPAHCLLSTIAAVDDAGIAHDHVVFEVVEADRTADVSHLRRVLDVYRSAGFVVALDDFGEGYSSVNMLHQLRPDIVKLDAALTRGVHEDSFKALIAARLLEIADRLGIRTVVEGIECEEEMAWARAHGATYAQGYHIGRPSPATAR